MADSRRGGIEKIAHLFIAGHGASALHARDNSAHSWASPAGPPAASAGQATPGAPIPPAPSRAAAEQPNDRAAGAEAPPEPLASEPLHVPSPDPAAAPTAPAPQLSANLQLLLARAKVVAVLSGHLGPLAGPAAEAIAKGLARERSPVAMLYGPAEYACLHQFAAGSNASGQWPVLSGQSNQDNNKNNGHGSASHGKRQEPCCDLLLLPDWVFQFDLWPADRPIGSIALSYGSGSEGLMAAYGALKGLIARFGKPDEVLILPFGCNETEDAWGNERLTEMCNRFLHLTPRPLGDVNADVRVQGGPLQPICGGIDGIKALLDSIGKVRLTVIKPLESEPVNPEVVQPRSPRRRSVRLPTPAGPVTPSREPDRAQSPAAQDSSDVTVLVPVDAVPQDGEQVLHAMLQHRGLTQSGYFDVWRRSGLAATMAGSEGFIGAVDATGDVVALALWMCRQAQAGQIDDLASVAIAVRQPDDWLIEAAEAMPVPVTWLRWHPYQIAERYGLLFTPAESSHES